jgi:hypothetical protein
VKYGKHTVINNIAEGKIPTGHEVGIALKNF